MALVADSAADHRLAGYINSVWMEADEVRQNFDWEWDEAIDFYMSMMQMDMPQGAEWMNPAILDEFYIALESVLPLVVGRLYENPRSFSFEAPALAGSRVQRYVEKAVRMQRERAAFAPRSVPAVRMGLMQGHMIVKNYWLREVGQKMQAVFGNMELDADGQPRQRIIDHEIIEYMSFNGPWTDFCDLKKVWKSPGKDWRGRPLGVIEEIPYNVNYMFEMQEKFRKNRGEPLYEEEALNSMRDIKNRRVPQLGTSQWLGQARRGGWSMWDRSSASISSGADETALSGHGSAPLVQFLGFVPPEEAGGKDYDDTQWRMILLTPTGQRLRDEKIPTPDLRPWHRDVFFTQVGHEPYGRSPLRWAKNDIEQMSQLRNLRIADVWSQVIGTWVVANDAGFENLEWLKYPGAVMSYSDARGRPWNQVLGVVPKQSQTQDVWLEQNDMAKRVQRATMADANTMGQSYGSRTPATESMLIDKKHGARVDLLTALVAWGLEQVSMQDYFELDKCYLEEGITVDFDDQGQPIKVSAANLDFDVDVTVDAGAFGSMNAFQLDAITKGMGAMFSDPEMSMLMDKREMGEEFWWRIGFQNVNRIMKSQEEFEREVEANRQHEALVAQLAGQARGAGRPAG